MTAPLRAVTFDYWDTLVEGTVERERTQMRRAAFRELLHDLGHPATEDEVAALHREVARDLDRWWRDEHRGYTTEEAVTHLLAKRDIGLPHDDPRVKRAAQAIDEALMVHPPELLPGAADVLERLAVRFRLAIVSDTGIASGRAQDRVLDLRNIRRLFVATVYSADIGWAKPRPEIFRAALTALAVPPAEALHVGDIERTDIVGAIGMGMRAIRADIVRSSGSSDAELVGTTLHEIADYLLAQD
ncbi:MAG: HAD family hydrolase [Gemmatimonadetes bacterium]|nr:HAD family hydrolase [Gemmatimonadota bacterium]